MPAVTQRQVLWRRLDVEGRDACRYRHMGGGWRIEGQALFLEAGEIASLSYRLDCGADWRSRTASVRGWIGERTLSLDLAQDSGGGWTANGERLDGVAGLLDIDLGFTPASNTNAIRRLQPREGQEIETTAVWLDTADWRIKPLPQSYRRLSPQRLLYNSPLHAYRAELEVDDFGIVTHYPGLWRALPPQAADRPG